MDDVEKPWRRPWSQRPIVLAVATIVVGVLSVYYLIHDARPRSGPDPPPSCTDLGGHYVVTATFYGTEANDDMRRAVAALRDDDRVAEITSTQPVPESPAQYPSAVVELVPAEDVNTVELADDLSFELTGWPHVEPRCEEP